MIKAGFAPSTGFHYTRTRYKLACCARDSWELTSPQHARERRYRGERDDYRGNRDWVQRERREPRREFRESPRYRERETQRRPSTNPETLLIRDALDSGDDLLYGINPVLLALQSGRRRFTRLFMQIREKSSLKSDNQAAVEKIIDICTERGIPLSQVSKGGLNALSGDRPHQGMILASGELPVSTISRLELSSGIWIALDEVTDPHNVGAIIRSATFLGAEGVILCKKNCSSLTPTVSKASAGGMEMAEVRYVWSMPRFLRCAKEDGWTIVGLGIDGGVDISDVDEHGSMIIVVGSEGFGLRNMVKKSCDKLVRISGGHMTKIDSLNVSVAAGVALYQLASGASHGVENTNPSSSKKDVDGQLD